MFLCSPIGSVANPYRDKLPFDSDDPDLIYAAARNVDITPGCCRHVADHAAARRKSPFRELIQCWIETYDGVRGYTRFTVPNHAIRRHRDAIGSGPRPSR